MVNAPKNLPLSPVDEVFSELAEKPLGAASLAQCHRGVLQDGRVVAVKIQHPDVRKNAYTDMDTMDVSLCLLVLSHPRASQQLSVWPIYG